MQTRQALSSSTFNDDRWRWRFYGLLVALRFYGSIGFLGMIHPDEFFQSQEVMARAVLTDDPKLRRQLFLPWEYHLPTPNRSVLFPALIAGLPYHLMKFLQIPLTGTLLLIIPRVWLCCISLAIDKTIYAVAKKLHHEDPLTVLLQFASSWPTIVFLSRPFSNTCETLILALCFAVLFLGNRHKRIGAFHVQTMLLGGLLAVGFFSRFTFLVFFFPLGVELVQRQDQLRFETATKKNDQAPSILQRLTGVIHVAVQGFVAFVMCSLVFIGIDTWYFRPELLQKQKSPRQLLDEVVISPLNNLIYNLQYDNLEVHGVHPRITHFAVNMLMLFGPLFIRYLIDLLTDKQRQGGSHRFRVLRIMSILFPLACLSMAPHQEPRFLLPLLVPLHLFTTSLFNNRLHTMFWMIFNVILLTFFGVLHQGGLIPLLLSLSSGGGSTVVSLSACNWKPDFDPQLIGMEPLVFYKTYMPPRFLLAGLPVTSSFKVIDLGGHATDLPELLSPQLKSPGSPRTFFLALPASVSIDSFTTATSSVRSASYVGGCYPHITTEDLSLSKPFTLDLYHLTLVDKNNSE